MIKAIRKNISLPLVVGGGIRTPELALEVFDAGADMVVVGNAVEKEPALIKEFCQARNSLNK
jgi:heptaprenylglyceryl phosphate synthase